MIRLVVVLVVFILAMILGHCSAQAQTPITSQNILTPTVGAWSGSVVGQAGGFSGGGNGPAYNPATNTLIFGYTTGTATQRINAEAFAIQHALDLSNSGIKINGYNYSWMINNSGDNIGTLTGKVEMLRGGNALQSYTYNYSTPTQGFETKTGTQTFNNPQDLLAADQITLSFTGKDARFWAGYYGPQVREPSLTLNYTTDPCMSNPAFSPSCAGFNNVLTSRRMYAESYAINQALDLVGAGLKIHGLNYGYDYVLGGQWCSVAGTNADGTLGCSMMSPSSIAVGVAVTKSDGSVLYSNAHLHEEQNSSGSIRNSHVFNKSLMLGDMGGFALVDQVNGTGAVFNKFSSWQYTPDPCVVNPLSSTTCSGYQAAYQAQMCAANPTYNSACPGYAAAMFTQQCTANPLSDPSCPSYASAYLTYQCTINPLYSTTCVGYETAYFNQQCSIDATYNSRCPGYAPAYKTRQCTASPLYATDCPGYEQAYLNAQCIRDSLYSRLCEGYNTAYAIKYLTPISTDSTLSTAVNGSLSDTAATKANDPATTKVAVNTVTTTINTDGSISTGVSTTGDTNVDKAITSKASTTNTAPAAVQLAPPPPPPQQQMAQNEPKGGDKPEPKGGNDKQEDKKDDAPKGTGGTNPPQNTNNAQASSDKPAAPTARQELQARREAAAKADAVEKGKNLAGEMGKASDLEAQKAVQNVVIQAMGFTPGFDAYSRQIIVQQQFYKPYQVYGNQKTIDNRANLRMFGGTDKLHNEMVDAQYNREK